MPRTAIVYSDHARETIKERKFPRGIVVEVVQNPDEIVPSFRGRQLRRKMFGDRILEVVTITEETKLVVITAYYLKEGRNEN
ncbi:hypothetical protein A2630_00940 [Candidatus Woesebacteria bacterium RIFCSPHIGHO2_01_FULL_44_10]|uniref:DUF4258 domain-containing protein n=1 Tax=Candidatus Woesebacteria bacterium RIFCSPLOWO2_01_FULL_44_14 TaxID=1802525 RepID=A0A1F8C1I1_9BACT|nr:MAG: hypothetical protein A2630_00940 [Candidatus Woesebacteria bacterium RIFCSPHIGHO2_01_FULL_44_10]OGM54313.1 MAG: hypothetical protein A3F62_00985 [Candidatus Woesebacteria bacterium RIFCSPHIGHO2_12_FULL_44_11]OGM70214.1 MAG: hypothetical protein A2975_04035 [Candidatus Woesebacteria bacterium RIFCSPLOWO2_01_FULL_44_14]